MKKNNRTQQPASNTIEISATQNGRLNVIAIGASAGGLEALQDFLSNLPVIENCCIIVAQHLSPTHKSMLVQLLSRETKLEVAEAIHLAKIEPDKIYITPPDKEITISKRQIILSKPEAAVRPKPSVDVLFKSLAKEADLYVIGIILSGTGTDGSAGIQSIKNGGGLTLAQEPGTAKYDGMPQAAIETGMVELVLPPDQMGAAIKDYLLHPGQQPKDKKQLPVSESTLGKIFHLLSRRMGTDFSNYKSATIHRRIEKRLAMLNIETIEEYVSYIEKNPKELDEMFNMILIGVTTFFRDKEAFEVLEELLQEKIRSKQNQDSIRVWIPGCSTGEEAFSIAIILNKLLKDRTHQFNVQIFATDIDEKAIAKARKGIFAASSVEHLPESIITEYFTRTGDSFELSKAVRSMVLFSKHDLTNNPPFLKLDLISCRNLLIYFNATLQQQVLPIFHYALQQDGYLFLGKSETIGHFSDLFAAIDSTNKIFQRKRGGSLHTIRFSAFKPQHQIAAPAAVSRYAGPPESISDLVKETLFNTFEHPYVVINDEYDIQEVNGDLRLFLTLPQGSIQVNLLKMVNLELQTEVRAIVTKAIKKRELVKSSIRKFDLFGNTFYVRIVAKPLIYREANDELFIVIFEQLDLEEFVTQGVIDNEEDWVNFRIQELEHELAATREHLQTYIEELETSNEEMQSLNEELQSTNEELQSSNEELETSNEELQSSNEEIQITYSELKTVNEELERKEKLIKENEANLNALLNNNLQAFVLADTTYKVLAFNNKAEELFLALRNKKITPGDTIIDFLAPGQLEDFIKDFRRVTAGGTFSGEKAIKDANGRERWFSLQFTPVIVEDNQVKGISIGMLDITDLKTALTDLNATERLLSSVFNATSIGICVTDEQGRFVDVNESYCQIYGYTKNELIGQNLTMMVPPEHRVSTQALHDEFIKTGVEMPAEWEVIKKDGTAISIFVTASLLVRPDGKRCKVTSVRDISVQKHAKRKLEASQKKYKAIFDNSMNAIFLSKPDGTILETNQTACDMFGYTKDEFRTLGRSGIIDQNDKVLFEKLEERLKYGKARGELYGIRKNGERFQVEFSSVVYQNESGIDLTCTVVNDISERKKAERDVSLLINNTEESFILLDKDLHIVSFNNQFQRLYSEYFGITIKKENHILDYAAPNRKEIVAKIYGNVLKGQHEESEIAVPVKTGETKVFSIKYKPAKDEKDDIIGVFVSAIDITEQKKSSELLVANEKKFRSLIENAADGFVILDATGTPTFVSSSVQRILGYTEDEAMHLNLLELIHPDDVEKVNEKVVSCLSKPGESMAGYTARTRHKNGSWRWLEATITNLLDDQAVRGIVDNFRDVTEKIQQRNEIIRVKTNQEALINGTQDLIWSIDRQLCIITANSAYLEMMKIATNRTIRDGDSVIVDEFGEELVNKWRRYYERVLNGESYQIKEQVYDPLQKQMVYGLISFNPIFDETGQITGAACYSKDITEEVVQQIALNDAKNEIENILNQSLDIICTIDEEGNFIKVSAAAEKIWGYKPEELSGKPYMDFVFEEDHDKTQKTANDIQSGIEMTNFENRYVRKDGSLVTISWSARWDDAEKTMFCIARDATAKKEAEAQLEMSEKRFKSLVQDGSDLIGILDLEANYIYVSPTSYPILGIKPEEFVGRNAFEFIHPDDKEEVFSNFSRLDSEKRISISPFRFVHKDGSWRWIETVVTNLSDDPAVNGIVANSQDVTERIKSEEELRNSEENYRQMFEHSPLPKFIYELDTYRILDVNATAIHHYGYTKEEFLQLTLKDIGLPEDADRLMKVHHQHKNQKGSIKLGQFSHCKKNGEQIQAELSGHQFKYRDKVCMMLVSSDVTSRENALQQLKSNEAKLTAAQKIAKLGYWQLDVGTGNLYWSDEVYNIWGRSRDSFEVNFDSFLDTIHPDDMKDFLIDQTAAAAGQKDHDFEHRIILPDGSVKWVHEIGKLVKDETGKPVSFEGTVQDITPQKKLALSLKESNERYKHVTRATFDAIWDWDLKKGTLYWGDNFKMLFGHEAGSYNGGGYALLLDPIHADERERIFDSIHDVIQNGDTHWEEQYRYQKANGEYAYVINKGIVLRDESGQAYQMVGAMQDITRQKKEEHRLKLLESVITNTNDAVLITEAEPLDEPGPRIVYVNEAFTNMTGYTPEEVIGKSPRILQGPKSDRKELDRLREALEKWESCEITTINYKKNGEEFWINFTVSPVADEKGWFTHWIAIEKDVTVRKNQELQKQLISEIGQIFNEPLDLRDSLQKVLMRIAKMLDFTIAEAWLINEARQHINLFATYAANDDGRTFYENSSDIRETTKNNGLSGITWSEATLQIWQNISQIEKFSRRAAAEKAGLKTAYSIPLFYNAEIIGVLILGSDNELHTGHIHSTLFETLGDNFGAEIKRKQLEQELNQIFNLAPDIICIAGLDGYFKKINPAMCSLLEYTEEELLSIPFIELVFDEDKEKSIGELKRLGEGNSTFYFENRYVTKSGRIVWLAWTAVPAHDDKLLYSVAKDITEKKELEELIDEMSRLARIGAWEVDLVKNELYWSDMTRKIHEVEPDFVPDLDTSINFYVEEDRPIVNEAVKRAIKHNIPFDFELRILTAKGNERWVRSIGRSEFEDGVCIKLLGSFQDIHSKKLVELALERSNKSLTDYKLALDEASNVVITDSEGVILYVNESTCELSGYSREELIGQHTRINKSGYHPAVFFDEMWKTISAGNTWRGELKNKAKDGSLYWVDTTIIPFTDKQGKPFQYLAIRFDITAKKNAETAVIKALEEKNTILESIGDCFFALDKDWTVTYWNRAAEEVLQMKKEQIVGKNLWEVYDDAIPTAFYENYRKAMEKNVAVHFQEYYEALAIWFEVSAYPSANGLSVYFKDVTHRKEAEERIRQSNERFEKVAQATNDAIWDWDIVNEGLYWGEGYATLFGHDPAKKDKTLASWSDLIHPDELDQVLDSLQKALDDKNVKIWQEEYRFKKSDGSYAFVVDRGSIIRNETGKAIRIVGALHDITRHKEHEETLKKLNADLEASIRDLAISNQELEQFAYVASHDLQEPLRMVTSFLSRLEKKYGDILDEKGKKYIHFAVDGTRRMRQIILDLLEFSRVGRTEDNLEKVDLNELIEEINSLYHRQIEEKNAKITFSDLPQLVTYRTPLRQVFQNLISNSLKYHKDGIPPVIRISFSETQTHWQFAVEDNGIGIDPEYYDKIFIIFQRLHNKDEYSGTGIGLAITKKIIENLGGSIWLESAEGEGCCFYFTIEKQKESNPEEK